MAIISIITINYNNHKGLEKTIQSVLNQDYNNLEYLIIDGGSTDGSSEIIKKYSDRLSFWCSEPDNGIYNAMNKGILKASGQYLLFLNSGDTLTDEILTKVSPLLTGEDFVYGNLYLVKEQKLIQPFLYDQKLSSHHFLFQTIGHPSTFIKRTIFKDALYNESLKIVSDWELFLVKIVLQDATFKYIPYFISNFDMSGITGCGENEAEIIKEREIVINKYFSKMMQADIQRLAMYDRSPFSQLIPKLSKTKKFHKRIVRLVGFLLKVNNIFSKH